MHVLPSRRAFTLIELLIVVAIIAILAAIAVPNFLEAQTRAKVSRVKNDMRTIATAMESYFVDSNTYPGDSDNTLGNNCQGGLAYLTTPIAYITTLVRDPFQTQRSANDSASAIYYEMGSGTDNAGWGNAPWRFGAGCQSVGKQNFLANEGIKAWFIYSGGPDETDNTSGNDLWPGYGTQNSPGMILLEIYDPTNGTVSDGDIYRAGGLQNVGNYSVSGQYLGPVNRD